MLTGFITESNKIVLICPKYCFSVKKLSVFLVLSFVQNRKDQVFTVYYMSFSKYESSLPLTDPHMSSETVWFLPSSSNTSTSSIPSPEP